MHQDVLPPEMLGNILQALFSAGVVHLHPERIDDKSIEERLASIPSIHMKTSELIEKYPDRIGYLHLKQVNPQVVAQVLDKDLSFPEAVRMGAMIEPPLGVPDIHIEIDATRSGIRSEERRDAADRAAGTDVGELVTERDGPLGTAADRRRRPADDPFGHFRAGAHFLADSL